MSLTTPSQSLVRVHTCLLMSWLAFRIVPCWAAVTYKPPELHQVSAVSAYGARTRTGSGFEQAFLHQCSHFSCCSMLDDNDIRADVGTCVQMMTTQSLVMVMRPACTVTCVLATCAHSLRRSRR